MIGSISDESESLSSVVDRFEGSFVSSDISSEVGDSMFGDDEGEEEEHNLEWEVLLELNNLERNSEPYVLEEQIDQQSEISRNDLPEDYVLAMEYDALSGMVVENANPLKGSPPAAKSVVENLPMVIVTKEEVGENSNNNMVACAVCKDEASVGEKVTRLPCCFMYHGECILPWLEISNTCPVCRFELPTDDADYEKRRRRRGGGVCSPG